MAIVSLGLALVIGTRGIDISVGSVMAVAAATMAATLWLGPLPAIVIALLAGALLGVVNGTLVAHVGIQPIVATLGMLVAGRGIALVIAEGRLTEIFDAFLGSLGSGSIPIPWIETVEPLSRFAAGVPFVLIITIAIAVAIAFVVGRTTFGRHILATGGNPTAARLSGVPVKRTLVAVYVVSRPPGGRRRRHRHGAHGRRGPLLPGQPHRAQRDHGGRRRRHAVLGWQGAHPGHPRGSALHAAHRGHAHPQQPLRLGGAHGRGAHHRHGRLHPARAEA